VELNIDTGQANGTAHYIGSRLDREPAEAATWQRLLPRPHQRAPQRSGIGRKRTLDLQGRLEADRTFERGLYRGTCDTQFQPAPAAIKCGGKITKCQARVHWRIVPDEAAGRAKTL